MLAVGLHDVPLVDALHLVVGDGVGAAHARPRPTSRSARGSRRRRGRRGEARPGAGPIARAVARARAEGADGAHADGSLAGPAAAQAGARRAQAAAATQAVGAVGVDPGAHGVGGAEGHEPGRHRGGRARVGGGLRRVGDPRDVGRNGGRRGRGRGRALAAAEDEGEGEGRAGVHGVVHRGGWTTAARRSSRGCHRWGQRIHATRCSASSGPTSSWRKCPAPRSTAWG